MMNKTWIKEHWLEILLCVGIVIQIGALAVFNLTRLPYESNYDSSCAYAQIVEMWRQKRILLKDWAYQTTLGIDSPVLLGALFYGITKNAFTAFGLANIVTVIVYACLFYDILKQADVKKNMRLLAVLFLLTPYSTGQLGYMPMLFTSAGSYAYKLLVPLLLIDILVRMHKGQEIKKYWYLILFATFFVFDTAVSSGEYILLCAVLPLVGYEILHVLIGNDIKQIFNKRLGFLILESAIYVVGIKVGRRTGIIESVGSQMMLTKAKHFPSVIAKCLTGIFQLFGGIPDYEDIPVTQTYGMMYLFRFFLAAVILASWIYLLKHLKENEKYKELVGMITCIFAVNLIVLIFANVNYATKTFEYRYHLISMIPMILLTSIAASDLWEKRKLLEQTIVLVTIVLLLFVNVYDYKNYMRDCYNYQGDMQGITLTAEQEGVHLIIAIGSESISMGRCMRNVNPNVEISTWGGYNHGVGWGASTYYFDNAHLKTPYMVLMTQKEYELMPKQIAKQLEEVQTFGLFQLYRVKENVLDGDNTLPQSGTNRDFCYSSGYEYWGKMESDGNVLSSGKKETVLRSNKKKIKRDATYDMIVHYEVIQAKEDSAAVFRVRNAQDEIIAEQEMPKDATEIRIRDVSVTQSMEWIRYRINAQKGSKIRIKSIETVAQ
ncbi:MAG: hypothetical protein KHW88_01555 [Lachnospiraceae bacterium]|nr:hypothetical protein [Lachnospiraceae bacterium]